MDAHAASDASTTFVGSAARATSDDVVGLRDPATETLEADGSTIKVALQIDSLDGYEDGHLAEDNGGHCGGSIAFDRRRGSAVVFDYVEEDEPSHCTTTSTVTVRATPDGGLEFVDRYTFEGTAGSVSGELSPAG